ncbi:MAG: hypothetical protein IPL84_07270 [Chitinophagaceae bacterium]|nr:hypothetical protein [Chitinophagaceae bacterium]
MNINRHNYEAFFLLYVDKELSAADRKAVDQFVRENPDLQMELQLLQQTIVAADNTVLGKKDWLYREEDITALQESLLLYADGEITDEDRKAVVHLLNTDKTAAAEWGILQKTKLQPDTSIVFEDKKSLYRTEGGRVIGFRWWRAAAAALLIGAGLWTAVSVIKNSSKATNESNKLVKTGGSKAENTDPVVTTDNSTAIIPVKEPAVQETLASVNKQEAVRQPVKEIATAEIKKNEKENKAVANDNVAVEDRNIKKQDNNLPKPYFDNINNKPRNETLIANVSPENKTSNRVSGNNDVVAKIKPDEKPENQAVVDLNKSNKTNPTMIAATQVVNNNTANENKDSRYLDVNDGKEKRTALGGFLRKAKRVLERTTNINTGEGVKIAGFEIALK